MKLLDKLVASLDPAHSIDVEDERNLPQGNTNHREAAVLVPITQRAEPGVILTQRPDWLKSHPGQVSFPGGKIDDQDEDAVAAALREADEELAMPRTVIDIKGTADVYYSGSGFAITPVLGIIPPDLELKPHPGEVEDWFEVPLAFLLDPANATRKKAFWRGEDRHYYDMQWQNRRIWGVTAGIIANLVRRMEAYDAAS